MLRICIGRLLQLSRVISGPDGDRPHQSLSTETADGSQESQPRTNFQLILLISRLRSAALQISLPRCVDANTGINPLRRESMIGIPQRAVAVIAGICAIGLAPAAHADQGVTYEVTSTEIPTATIEYFDGTARQVVHDAPLPWRTTVTVANPSSWGTDGAEVRADWRPGHVPVGPLGAPALASKWVTVRIYFGNIIRCENTLDVGDAACHGATPFDNS